MAIYVLENEFLKITIDSFGAELKSIQNKVKNNLEYMWCADPSFWKRTSPVLFPLVGSLKNKTYTFKGREYEMSQHGFARDMEFELDEQNDNKIIFQLKDTAETNKIYPFSFTLRIGYELVENSVHVKWMVTNNGKDNMFFSIGGHPAFNCPMKKGEKQTDYTIAFDTKDEIISSVIGEGGLLSEQKKKYVLQDGVLAVTEDLFDQDALVIENDQAHQVALQDADGNPYITLCFDAPLFGIWSPTRKNAPFICIEPWYGRCDRENFQGMLEDREWSNTLAPDEEFAKTYSIVVS